MDYSLADLELSAVRAFLGRIHPNVRLLYVATENTRILLVAVCDFLTSEEIKKTISYDLLEASSEIISDFPEMDISTGLYVDLDVVQALLPKARRLIFEAYQGE